MRALLGTSYPANPVARQWRERSWCIGGNDKFGDCAFAAIGNWHAMATGEVMLEGEVEHAYSRIAGFLPTRPETDHGARIADVVDYMTREGWPGDPMLKPVRTCKVEPNDLAAACSLFGGAYTWLTLPRGDGGWDFTDFALDRFQPPEGPHAVFVVDAGTMVTMITWGAPVTVSREWWRRYSSGEAYGMQHPRAPAEWTAGVMFA